MGSIRLTLCSGLLTAVALTPTAYAADGAGDSAIPLTPPAGTDAAVRASDCGKAATSLYDMTIACARDSLVGKIAPVQESDRQSGHGDDSGEQSDQGDRSDSPSGRDNQSDGQSDQSGRDNQSDPASSAPSAQPSGVVSPTPVAPVPAGGGGAARLASEDARRAAGPGTAQAVTGLVLAGLAAIAVGLLPRAFGTARAGGTSSAARRRRGSH
ncbi:hypothetical protein [Streptomyces sp. NPDC046805]|uniref:hypothetical protein n=1 Tax=Streptomyces sp. NPDC046805 TaxID=3155134 RepID=UPI0033D3F1C3